MNVMHSCRCCLRCPPDRDLTTPYKHLGTTEIYSHMLKECFDLHLPVGGDGSCGICSACVGRLRDASDFKLQVQRSQAELRARLQGAVRVKEEDTSVEAEIKDEDGSSEEPVLVKPEMLDEDGTGDEMLCEEPPVKQEMLDEDGTGDEMLYEELIVKLEPIDKADEKVLHEDPLESKAAGDVTSAGDSSATVALVGAAWPVYAIASSQLAMNFSTRLECLRGDEAPLLESRRASHMKETHSRGTSSEQLSCKYIFVKHTQAHAGLNCGICNKTFKKSSDLKRHELIHTGVRPYICDECNKQFRRKNHLNTHKKIHTGENLYRCEECNKQFTLKGNLERHMRKHTGEKPYSCKECNKRFTQKSSLKTHKRIHTGEKPYMCGQCDKQFAHKCNLVTHTRFHTGGKPYK